MRGNGIISLNRTKEEMDLWKVKDPVSRFKETLMDGGVLSEAMSNEILDLVRAEIKEAVKFARESPEPALSTIKHHLNSRDEPNYLGVASAAAVEENLSNERLLTLQEACQRGPGRGDGTGPDSLLPRRGYRSIRRHHWLH